MTTYQRFLGRKMQRRQTAGHAVKDCDISIRFLRLVDRLFSCSEVAFLLILGSPPQEEASADLGRVYQGLVRLFDHGYAWGEELSWDSDQRVTRDLETTEAVHPELASLAREPLPPWALLWQGALDSHPHIRWEGMTFQEALRQLAEVSGQVIAEELALYQTLIGPPTSKRGADRIV